MKYFEGVVIGSRPDGYAAGDITGYAQLVSVVELQGRYYKSQNSSLNDLIHVVHPRPSVSNGIQDVYEFFKKKLGF